jgi:uncharacterized membrane protein
MHPKEFIDQLDEAKIAAAIGRAEQGTSGEIRVCVSHRHRVDALAAAQKRFLQLGMARTPKRNAVLIYFAPRAQTFALWGDTGVHEKCSDAFWQALAAKTSLRLKAGQFSQAVEETVHDVGKMLEQHFPRSSIGQNHLRNTIVRD